MTANPAGRSPLLIDAARTMAAALLLSACGGGGEAGFSRAGTDTAATSSPASRAFSAQAAVRLERKVWAETLEAPVRIEPDGRRSMQVTAPAAGRIESVAIKDFYQTVKAGETLAALYSPELLTAQREYLLIDPRKEPALARRAEERLARMGLPAGLIRSLRERGAPLERTPIAAPGDGFVIPVSMEPETPPRGAGGGASGEAMGGGTAGGMGGMGGMSGGNGGAAAGSLAGAAPGAADPLRAGAYVERGTALAEINDLAVVAAQISLPAALAGLFRVGDSVHLELREAGFAGMARLDFLAAQVADSGGNIVASAYLANRDGRLRPGLLGKAHLAPAPETAWVLPRAAVHGLGDRQLVWARSDEDTGAFEAREVRIWRAGARYVEILDGLAPGAAVAAEASLLVDPDAMAEPLSPPADGIPPAAAPHAGHAEHAEHGPAPDRIGTPDPEHASSAEAHSGHGGGAAEAGASARANEAPEVLRLPAEKVRLAGIRTAVAEISPLAATRTFRAVIRWDARAREDVPARAEGRILQVAVLRPGEKVARGQVLATLESESALAAQEEFLALRRRAPDLPSDLARTQIQAARRRLETLGLSSGRIDLLAARGRPFPALPIPSPRDGIVLEASARPGRYVSAGAPLFSIGLADRVWAETWLLPEEVGAYPVGTEAWVRVEGSAGAPIPGRLEHARPAASGAGTATLAHVAFADPGGGNSARILPGTQAWVSFRQPARAVLNLPESAVLRSSGMAEAWVEAEAGAYAPRMVRTGTEADGRVEILAGVAPGERVVIAGGYLLRSEWTLRHGAGMAHGGH